jgi:hypothetical protein
MSFPLLTGNVHSVRASLEPQTAVSDSPSSTRYCLYEAGREYLIYQPEPDTPFTVELPAGTYEYDWINPVAGKTRAGTIESAHGKARFTAPFPWPAVLHLRRAGDQVHRSATRLDAQRLNKDQR